MDTGSISLSITPLMASHIVDLPDADSPVIPIIILFVGLFISLFENLEIKSGLISIKTGISAFLSYANTCLNFV